MPDPDIAAAFAELYGACGLAAPAVRVERCERSYRRTAEILSGGGGRMPWSAYSAIIVATFMFLVALISVLVCAAWLGIVSPTPAPIISSGTDAAWIAANIPTSAALGYAAFRIFLLIDGRTQRLASWAGLSAIRSTPPVIASALSSALRQAGPPAGGDLGRFDSFTAGCFRLGRRRVLEAGPDPRMVALVGLATADPDAPLVLRFASAAAATVDEAILMDGLVLALAPGAAKPLPLWKLPARHDPSGIRAAPLPDAGSAADPVLADMVLLISAAAPPDRVEAMLRRLGLDASAEALGIGPSVSDGAGSLYRFSPVLCMVRVEDKVAGPDGTPLVHWVTVPPHVLTAREGVAWSFGLPDGDYRPTSES